MLVKIKNLRRIFKETFNTYFPFFLDEYYGDSDADYIPEGVLNFLYILIFVIVLLL